MTLGDGTAWDTTKPANSDNVSAADDEIRDIRVGVETRINKEHKTLARASAGGVNLLGSGRIYFQDATPTKKPDGTTDLDTDDDGRIFVDKNDNNIPYVYEDGSGGTDWEKLMIHNSAVIVAAKGANADYNAVPLIANGKFTADGTTQTIVVFGFAPIKFLQIAYTDGSSNAQSIQVIKTSTGSFDYFVSNAIPELDAVTLLTGDDAGKFSFNTGGYSGLVMHFVAFGDWTT